MDVNKTLLVRGKGREATHFAIQGLESGAIHI
jgi:hypothetical protein